MKSAKPGSALGPVKTVNGYEKAGRAPGRRSQGRRPGDSAEALGDGNDFVRLPCRPPEDTLAAGAHTRYDAFVMSVRLLWLLPSLFLFASCGPPELHVHNPLAALNWSPHDGASGIELEAEPSVCLSRKLDEGTLDFASLRSGDAEPGKIPQAKVPVTVELSDVDEACIVFREPDLQPGATYHMVLEPGLASRDGQVLEVSLYSRFRTVEE